MFVEDYNTAEDVVDGSVWVQSQNDVNGVWRFHDGSQMPGFLQNYIIESNYPGEDRLRYRIPTGKLLGRKPTFSHSYMCEHRFFLKMIGYFFQTSCTRKFTVDVFYQF